MLRHVPPVAFPIKAVDLWQGLASLWQGDRAVEQFRSSLLAATGAPACALVSSGRAALTVILAALRRLWHAGPGDLSDIGSPSAKVIVPAYSCPTVVQSVVAAGLVPVLCDVSPETLDLDRAALGRLLEPGLLAVVPAHLYGWAQDERDLLGMGREKGFFVVEDAAQAFGAFLDGRMVGTWGDAGLYSLGRGKCLPAGQGGVIVAGERCAPAIAAAVEEMEWVRHDSIWRVLRTLSLLAGYALATRPAGWWWVARTPLNPADEGMEVESLPPIEPGLLGAAIAGIGAAILAREDHVRAIRRRNAQRLMALMPSNSVSIPAISAGSEPAFLRLPVVVDEAERANRLFAELWRRGIGVSRSYRRSLPDLFSRLLGTEESDFPGAANLARCLLTLPTHPHLEDDDLHRIAGAFRAV